MASLQKRKVKGIDYWALVESKRINGKPRPVIIEYFGNTKSFAEKLRNLAFSFQLKTNNYKN